VCKSPSAHQAARSKSRGDLPRALPAAAIMTTES
jgi:hypothetical protein